MTKIYDTMCEVTGQVRNTTTAKPKDESIRPSSITPHIPLTKETRRNNDIIKAQLRKQREGNFRARNRWLFGNKALRIPPTLPLPKLQRSCGNAPWLLSVEHLQDLCNKSTAIYCTDWARDFTNMFNFILNIWCQGNMHTLDLEFARFFAKIVGIASEERATTEQIITFHAAMVDASLAARTTGFLKEDPDEYWDCDLEFIGGQQIDFYRIKPLMRALIMVIDNRVDREFEAKSKDDLPDFEKQEVRLIRTGVTTGLTHPITFNGLSVIKTINENEVTTTLPEAVRFIMELDKRVEAHQAKRDMKILDYWLGLPKVLVTRFWGNPKYAHRGFVSWTGGENDWPVGPSTDWWKPGLIDDESIPLPDTSHVEDWRNKVEQQPMGEVE